MYIGYAGNEQGWWTVMGDNGDTKVRNLGAAIGTRFRSHDNIVWILGGDYNAAADVDRIQKLYDGISSTDTRHMFDFHTSRNGQSRDVLPALWDACAVYTDGVPHVRVRDNYLATPTLPVWLVEDYYEGRKSGTIMSSSRLRATAWNTILSGGLGGHFYGHEEVWHFDTPPTQSLPHDDPSRSWVAAMSDPGANLFGPIANVFSAARKWQELVPDFPGTDQFITANRGTGADAASGGVTPDGTLGLVYAHDFQNARTIDLAKLSLPVAASWIDPSNRGAAPVSAGTFTTAGQQAFSRTAANSGGDHDWVLLFE
jgi:hypothetical protein